MLENVSTVLGQVLKMLINFSTLGALGLSALTSTSIAPKDSPVRLAIEPRCGTLGGAIGDLNAGLFPLDAYKKIVAFGDAYSDGGVHNGSTFLPPVMVGSNTRAGGRPSNGQVWVEYLASTAGASVSGYAVDGAVVDKSMWPNAKLPNVNDFIQQEGMQLLTRIGKPETTLYTTFFGINDYEASGDGSKFPSVADNFLYNLLRLASSPTSAKNILIVDNYGMGQQSAAGEQYKQKLFASMSALRRMGVNIGFIDFSNLWKAILAKPESFGYTSTGSCLPKQDSRIEEACANPESTLYWLPNTPSTATHKIMAEYVVKALESCKA